MKDDLGFCLGKDDGCGYLAALEAPKLICLDLRTCQLMKKRTVSLQRGAGT